MSQKIEIARCTMCGVMPEVMRHTSGVENVRHVCSDPEQPDIVFQGRNAVRFWDAVQDAIEVVIEH